LSDHTQCVTDQQADRSSPTPAGHNSVAAQSGGVAPAWGMAGEEFRWAPERKATRLSEIDQGFVGIHWLVDWPKMAGLGHMCAHAPSVTDLHSAALTLGMGGFIGWCMREPGRSPIERTRNRAFEWTGSIGFLVDATQVWRKKLAKVSRPPGSRRAAFARGMEGRRHRPAGQSGGRTPYRRR
jgi:hypothetical protein